MKRVSILKRSAMVVVPLSFLVGCVAAVPALLGAGAVGGTAAATEMDETEIKILAETENYFGAKHGEIKISEYQDRTVAITYKVTYKGVLYSCQHSFASIKCQKPGG